MTRFLLWITMSVLPLLALTFPTLGDDISAKDAPPRTPWQKAAPTSDEGVRWVVEGCAAYPVTAKEPAVKISPGAKTDLAAQASRSIELE